jgi:N-acetylglucosamine-6-phosphate deacetylase
MTAGQIVAQGEVVIRGRLVLGSELLPGSLRVRDGRIVEVAPGPGPLAGAEREHVASVVAPGFIDLQVNGGFGVEVGETADAIRHLSASLPAAGVTAFLPTLVSSAADVYPRTLGAFMSARDSPGARPLGLHLEGPFLSLRRAGAHRPSAIQNAPPDLYEPFLEHDALRLVTLAPEVPLGLDRIRWLSGTGVAVSLGHTDASLEEFVAGIDAGAVMVTHLYSAMSGFGHRAPGAVGAALVDDRVSAGVIADGVHCHPASVRLALRAKGPDRVVLVTDAVAGAGMEPGVYQLDGRDILVDETVSRFPDGNLAGSVLTLDQAVRNVVEWGGASIADACRMASEVPARILGLRSKGWLAPGMDADLVLLDDALEVTATFREGRLLFLREDRPELAAGS